jgi:N-acetylglucosaminyldiphosphoundecaprenol N-acetyl-beta-D-mannosaminyltransferase
MKGQFLKIFSFEVFIGNIYETVSYRNLGIINTLNPHCFIEAKNDPVYMESLSESDLLLPDGVGIVIAARILAGRKIERIAGSDLHKIILDNLNKSGGSCFYLGSTEATLLKIKERLEKEKPHIRCGFFSPPFRQQFSETENQAMTDKINEFNPDVLFVGMTAPKQEKWVYMNRTRLNVQTICSIGAVFDFYAGTVKRPGQFWISLGLEWLPRLLREPRRLWRRNFISNPLFMWYVLKEKIKSSPATSRIESES